MNNSSSAFLNSLDAARSHDKLAFLVFLQVAFLDEHFEKVGILPADPFKLPQHVVTVFEKVLGELSNPGSGESGAELLRSRPSGHIRNRAWCFLDQGLILKKGSGTFAGTATERFAQRCLTPFRTDLTRWRCGRTLTDGNIVVLLATQGMLLDRRHEPLAHGRGSGQVPRTPPSWRLQSEIRHLACPWPRSRRR